MPKKVNHDERKKRVAEACWRTIRKEGIKQATVRKIAEEADMSVGAMRHYFDSQEELLVFSMRLVMERVAQRIEQLPFSDSSIECIEQILAQVLPVDEEKRLEMGVWYVFTAETLNIPAFKDLSDELYDGLHRLCAITIHRMAASGMITANVDEPLEIERLYAIVDGLAVHGIMAPERMTPELILSVLRYHLQSLCSKQN